MSMFMARDNRSGGSGVQELMVEISLRSLWNPSHFHFPTKFSTKTTMQKAVAITLSKSHTLDGIWRKCPLLCD